MDIQPIVIQYKSTKEIEQQAYEVILKTVNDAFIAAKGNVQAMRSLNQLARELNYATELALDELTRGPRSNKIPEPALEVSVGNHQ